MDRDQNLVIEGVNGEVRDARNPSSILYTYKEQVTSTQEVMKQIFLTDSRTRVLIAEQQSAGYGREGRSFYSPFGGLYFTLGFPVKKMESMDRWTLLMALAVRRSLLDRWKRTCDIKWVNDLYWNKKKVVGILCEARWMQDRAHLFCGVGANLFSRELPWPQDLDEKAGSLEIPPCSREERLAWVQSVVVTFFDLLQQNQTNPAPLIKEYEQAMIGLGNWVLCSDGNRRKLVGLTPDGYLETWRQSLKGLKKEIYSMGELRILPWKEEAYE